MDADNVNMESYIICAYLVEGIQGGSAPHDAFIQDKKNC